MTHYDAIIIGAGAAGLMCALRAGQRGRSVLLLDHANYPGAKILISGGGRCNFTNVNTTPANFHSQNPHFCKSALSRFTPADFIEMVQNAGIDYHEKTLGQLFCDGSAQAILDMLLSECAAANVTVQCATKVTEITKEDHFTLHSTGSTYTTHSLVIATGGLSIPKLGATNFAYETAKKFDLRIVPPRPGLVPLTFAEPLASMMRDLAGVSTECIASHQKTKFREAMLFTHRGLSGPAILQISSVWQSGEIALNLAPDHNTTDFLLTAKKQKPKQELRTILSEILPQRLSQMFAQELDAQSTKIADLPDVTLKTLAQKLATWRLTPDGTEGFAKAEVTCGGIDTRDLSSRTMQANAVPGLFFIGEAVDVTGWLGGYNFQWAWASGWCAGEEI